MIWAHWRANQHPSTSLLLVHVNLPLVPGSEPTGGQTPISSTRSAASGATPALEAHFASASLQVVALDMTGLVCKGENSEECTCCCRWRQR